MIVKRNTPEEIFIQEDDTSMQYGIDQDESIDGMVKYIRKDIQEQNIINRTVSWLRENAESYSYDTLVECPDDFINDYLAYIMRDEG